jgi:DNA-binding NarL/FixJ family response regulator
VKKELNDREKKIVELFKQGLSHEQIAEALSAPRRNLCEIMIRSHLVNASRKLGFTNRPQLEQSLRRGDAN